MSQVAKTLPWVLSGLLIATVSPAEAQQNIWTQAFTLYAECLQDLGARGDYTWTDGGTSAIRLAAACQTYGENVLEECMAKFAGHPEMRQTCQATNILYAQTVLRALHK